MEREGHLRLSVHALITQNSHLGPAIYGGAVDVGCGDVLCRVEGEVIGQSWIVYVEDSGVFLLCARRVIADRLHQIRCLGPHTLQLDPRRRQHRLPVAPEHNRVLGRVRRHRPNPVHVLCGETGFGKRRRQPQNIRLPHLHHRPEFLVEQRRHHVPVPYDRRQVNLSAHMSRKAHLRYRREQPPVRPIVIRQHNILLLRAFPHILHCLEEVPNQSRVLHIRRLISNLFIHLRERRPAQPLPSLRQIQKHQSRLPGHIPPQLRCQRTLCIDNAGKPCDDERERRGDLVRLTLGPPLHLHRHRVLPNGHRYTERRTQLHPDGLDGFVQTSALARMVRSAHPVS
ncbi:hypothetical protein BC938DRAFT_473205 [Jimgerdemannia flammicorona]|uniref:Uncharacterized protein n=1 Tax=Jimgerdemannia flammicorona TaxID=994334 RepID=A0A433QZS5_9FUNG|nr:hypothetical protein BC938DRAFT_473205 [Jimgerdemannia flammicorona]